ncbi:hypothetical protein [Brevifollis gellanilyticus]|uniref:Uncharacterized protein n=1 Tax=Brevifollis gellanilyticus TaxID=748831 RepID=A0A512M561_9BACT|nr:hypothetical protein [Brevifollis gellanilyticus]GEP41874.1 hypothetical protein BGE01nite_11650 [Brevifollis gellanilyticus]
MIQGWLGDDYLMLFDNQAEAMSFAARYEVTERLPGYALLGLRGWDDFILSDPEGGLHIVPTIPLVSDNITAYDLKTDLASMQPDPRFTDRIKWYVQPIVFGGDPSAEQNIIWISIDQHVDLVKWWNRKYDEIKG